MIIDPSVEADADARWQALRASVVQRQDARALEPPPPPVVRRWWRWPVLVVVGLLLGWLVMSAYRRNAQHLVCAPVDENLVQCCVGHEC